MSQSVQLPEGSTSEMDAVGLCNILHRENWGRHWNEKFLPLGCTGTGWIGQRYNSEDCAESYAIAEQRGSTTEFCQCRPQCCQMPNDGLKQVPSSNLT